MADVNNLDPKFLDFTFIGLDHGIDSIRDGGGPLIPFLLLQVGDKKELKRFVTEKYEDGIHAAEKAVRDLTPKPDFALIAFDGFITWEEKKYDAIFIRAFNKAEVEGFEFCQRYVPKTDGSGIEPIGNSAYLGTTTNLLTASAANSAEDKTEKKKPWWKF